MSAPNHEVALAHAVLRSVDDTTPGGLKRQSVQGAVRVFWRGVAVVACIDLLLAAAGIAAITWLNL